MGVQSLPWPVLPSLLPVPWHLSWFLLCQSPGTRETAFRTVPQENALSPQKSRRSSAAPTPRCTSTTDIPRIAPRGKLVTRQQQLRQRATRAGLLREKKVMRGNNVKLVKENIASTIKMNTNNNFF